MEQNKTENKNLFPLILIVFSIILIAIGVVLIATGNNKSFAVKKTNEVSNNIPSRLKKPINLSLEKVVDILENEISTKHSMENWTLGDVQIVAYNETGSYLIKFDKIYETNTETVESIIQYNNDSWAVEFPGWPAESRDLSQYNFIYQEEEYDDNTIIRSSEKITIE